MGLFDWLKLASLASSVVKAWRETVAFFTARENRQAGRNEVILEQKKANEDALTRMDEARARVDADGGAGELHDPDRRD